MGVVRRTYPAIVVDVKVVRTAAIAAARRGRPIVAIVTDKTQVVVAAITRSRVPDGRGFAKLSEEVHAFVGAVI